MMEKFRILTLEEYDRVLYLDYDVMPRCNLDYMMELSYTQRNGLLKENVVLAHLAEPSSGGFFILKPSRADYRSLQQIIRNVENSTMYMDFPHWDTTVGWGQPIVGPKDYWISSEGKKGYEWDWYGCQADQGLLYYWTKYVKKSVSILVTSSVEQWGADPITGEPIQERIDKGTIHEHSCSPGPKRRAAPYRDFVHLTGKKKPWHSNLTILEQGLNEENKRKYTAQEEWLWLLKDALQSIGMQDRISLDFIAGHLENAAVGTTPGHRQRNMYIKAKAANGWKQYQYEEVLGSKESNGRSVSRTREHLR
jgi:hypothetical protein